jgi:cytoskeletal protein RodZ
MNVEMKNIGNLFKDKRKEMNLSLKEVENATSIRMNYLQAIEEGQIDKFLSAVYALGFIKQYASFLGFDGERIVKENEQAFKLTKEKQDFSYGIGTLEVRNSSHGNMKWFPNALWIIVGGVVLISAWFFAKFLGVF